VIQQCYASLKSNFAKVSVAVGLIANANSMFATAIVGDAPIKGNPQIEMGEPSQSNTSIIISRKQYVISWNYALRTPEWVAWTLGSDSLGSTPRTNVFRLDHDLEEALVDQNQKSVEPNDYKGSCLDRGHQVASSDRTHSKTDNQATFFMSNMIPQSAYLNRHTWASLERFLQRQVKDNALQFQIYAGTIPDSKQRAIGPDEDILVPAANFKIAVIEPDKRNRGKKEQYKFFVVNFPNVTSKGTNPVTDHKQACLDSEHTMKIADTNKEAYWREYLSNLTQVEHDSGIDFSFLKSGHEMTEDEVDALISEDKSKPTTDSPAPTTEDEDH
jgi:endonuclease G, mitochondrial